MSANAPAQPPLTVSRPRGVASGYAPAPSPAWDEMLEPDGALRPHWRPLVSMLDDLGTGALQSRTEQARRLIRDNDITHNVYDDPTGFARPWALDVLPLPIAVEEWRRVGTALMQRARLLNALLADLYGPATAVTAGILPPELVYAAPNFLRPCHGTRPPQNRWLHLYAADVIRGSDGSFRVLADRTQAPSGAGYTLENRIVLSRVHPNMFAHCNVLRLAPFFIALRNTLASLAPTGREDPRVVLLTPGPYNETYFEHAYLGRYLGYPLVQGNDLTVRDGRVFLKTLGGLQRVDVILRRVDDDFCDPLELYGQSYLGVPGLLQAVRDRTVAVANALGSGATEGPAFLPFLPALCHHLLGEELQLPSVRTWWCGNPDSLRYVTEHLTELVIKPALPQKRNDPTFAGLLSSSDLQQLRAKLLANPKSFVAQEQIRGSHAPVLLGGDAAQARPFVVRAYLAAAGEGGGGYEVMPGGLTRVAGGADARVVSMQKGGGSKDTWVLGDAPQRHVSLLTPASAPVALSRGGSDLPSRLADDLFWLGRYVQRAEGTARLTRCVLNRVSDLNAADASLLPLAPLSPLLIGEDKFSLEGEAVADRLAAHLLAEPDPSGLRSAVNHFHSLGRVLRDRISPDAWQALQALQQAMVDTTPTTDASTLSRLLGRMVVGFLAFSGMVAESMTRGHAWRFLDIGLRIERGLHGAKLVRAGLSSLVPQDSMLLDTLLETSDTTLTYRRRYHNQLDAAAVADLLLADESNPRSVAFQLKVLHEHLECLPRELVHPQQCPELQLTLRLRSTLQLEDLLAACRVLPTAPAAPAALAKPVPSRPRLHQLTTELVNGLGSISELVGQTFFTHAAVAPRLLQSDPASTLTASVGGQMGSSP